MRVQLQRECAHRSFVRSLHVRRRCPKTEAHYTANFSTDTRAPHTLVRAQHQRQRARVLAPFMAEYGGNPVHCYVCPLKMSMLFGKGRCPRRSQTSVPHSAQAELDRFRRICRRDVPKKYYSFCGGGAGGRTRKDATLPLGNLYS